MADVTQLSGARVLVTGGNGFIGAHLTHALVEAGCSVSVSVRSSADCRRLAPLVDAIEVVRADLAGLSSRAFAKKLRPDVVFHVAAAGLGASRAEAQELLAANVLGTQAALELAHWAEARRFIYCGTGLEYGEAIRAAESAFPRPITEYGASKLAGCVLAHAFGARTGLDVVTLRPFTVYGPREPAHRLVPYCIEQAGRGAPFAVTTGRQTRDFVYVGDVVGAFLRAATLPGIGGETFNVCTGIETPVRRVVEMIVGMVGAGEPMFGASEHRQPEVWRNSGDPTLAAQHLGWQAETSLSEGLALTIAGGTTAAVAGGAP